jgi:hypothetical protein
MSLCFVLFSYTLVVRLCARGFVAGDYRAIVARAEDDDDVVHIARDCRGIRVRAFASPPLRGGGRRGASETANTRHRIVIVIGRWARE